MNIEDYIGKLVLREFSWPDRTFSVSKRKEDWNWIIKRLQASKSVIPVKILEVECHSIIGYLYIRDYNRYKNTVSVLIDSYDTNVSEQALLKCKEIAKFYIGGDWFLNKYCSRYHTVKIPT